ncbi:WD40 repeat-like protein [Rhizopogon salebrosus TDB-379]|nr:WD40 repeat-like protein [Rhizopogon salebrosus TDB-379]
MTLEGPHHKPSVYQLPDSGSDEVIDQSVSSISYFPDCRRIISGSGDGTIRQWDLKVGKEITEARDEHEQLGVLSFPAVVAVSKDSRWVVTAGADPDGFGTLIAYEVETGIVKAFEGHQHTVFCVDISEDNTLLASGSCGYTMIWSLETGEPVAGPFESDYLVHGAVRFSHDSNKVALMSLVGKCLEVWDVQAQNLDGRVGKPQVRVQSEDDWKQTRAPPLWTHNTIAAVFTFVDDDATTIYEFGASTFEIVGAPFEGHNDLVTGLTLSLDGALLASASYYDSTIKLWAFESRQLLASFQAEAFHIIFSPDSRQIAYTTYDLDSNIYICSIPPDIMHAQPNARHKRRSPGDLLIADVTTRPTAVLRNTATSPVISVARRSLRRLPTIDQQRPAFLRYVHKLLPSFRRNKAFLVRNDQPHDPLDIPATSCLSHDAAPSAEALAVNSRPKPAPPTRSSVTGPTTSISHQLNLSPRRSSQAGHSMLPTVDVPLAQGKERNATAGAPKKNSEYRRDEDFDPLPPPSPNSNSQQLSAATQINTGEHGSGRLCLCL